MLNENIKTARKSKGLSQQELATRLNVVRQTISKWEKGLSVPDSDLLISISEALDTPVSTLLGENIIAPEADGLKAISAKLEVINLQLAQRKTTRKRILHWLLISLCIAIAAIFAALCVLESPYLGWDYSSPETAVLGGFLPGNSKPQRFLIEFYRFFQVRHVDIVVVKCELHKIIPPLFKRLLLDYLAFQVYHL